MQKFRGVINKFQNAFYVRLLRIRGVWESFEMVVKDEVWNGVK